jgi:hypothetical protein
MGVSNSLVPPPPAGISEILHFLQKKDSIGVLGLTVAKCSPRKFPLFRPARRTRFGLFPRHVTRSNSLECFRYLLLVAPFEGHV